MTPAATLTEELDDLLRRRRLTTLFQPIVKLKSGEIFAYEALIRGPSDSPLHSAVNLFDIAARAGRQCDLEALSREINLKSFARSRLGGRVFLNVNPEFLRQGRLSVDLTRRYLSRLGLTPEQIVIELTENHLIEDVSGLHRAIDFFRNMGFAVAIDDLGAGYNGLRLWSELQPDFVKIDRYFIQGIDEDSRKRDLVSSLIDVARGFNCQIVAEGIETEQELKVVRDLGAAYGQGYLFARPSQSPPRALPSQLLACFGPGGGSDGRIRSETVASLIRPVTTVTPQTTISAVGDLFNHDRALQFLPVVDGDCFHALVLRQDLLALLAGRYGRDLYGRDLYGRDPIGSFPHREALVVARDTPVETLSKMITDGEAFKDVCFFVIVDNGHYLGIATLTDLLRRITDLHIRYARYANPLTLLPGNVPLNEHLDELLHEQVDFVVCYIDIDHFKPYNDHYGYYRGDEVLRQVARIIQDEVDAIRDFVGHIGGDDFLVIFRSEDWQLHCTRIMSRFEKELAILYDPADFQACGFGGETRSGERVFHPLISLSLGVVVAQNGQYSSCHEVASAASRAKKEAKKTSGSALFIERRRVTAPSAPCSAMGSPPPNKIASSSSLLSAVTQLQQCPDSMFATN